jgi:type VI secretion system secreted protein VgrG
MADDIVVGLESPLQKMVVTSVRAFEGISKLFRIDVDFLSDVRTKVEFDQIIGSKVAAWVILPDKKTKRYFNGIVSELSQTGRDNAFNHFHLEIVPQLWLSLLKTDCRIFQHEAVPDILKKVLTGIDVKFELQGTFEKRDYCVQYRESDFAFASRLMEEEGIYYFFKHTDKGHQMVVANTPQSHPDDPVQKSIVYDDSEGGTRQDTRVYRWEKTQVLRPGKVTLWDHCFQLPHKHLEAERPTQETVAVGKVTHKLALAANKPLEQYDYPGAYAQRVDDHDAGGGEKGDLSKIFQDNKRTVAIRMEQEAVNAITIRGNSNCRQLSAGFKLTLERHFDADGTYVLTSVEHNIQGPDPRTGGAGFRYQNSFTCIPIALPFRPKVETPKPLISGPQTAVIVGPPGEKIFCDKYARVKVQFHWDRKGKNDADSSCWVRVSQNWGGGNWGGMFVPHVGQEVIVEFEEGDPDRPVVTGRVYNAQCMPPLKLPDHKTQSIIRDHGSNEIKLQGDPGKQSIRMFSPHGNTIFKLGAKNDNAEGIFIRTDLDWDMHVVGDWLRGIDGKVEDEIKGMHTTRIYGATKERFYGIKDEYCQGVHHEFTLGAHTEVHVGTHIEVSGGLFVDIAKGRKFEREPENIEWPSVKLRKSKEELEHITNIVAKYVTLHEKIAEVCMEWRLVYQKMAQLTHEVTGAVAQNFGSLNTNVKGPCHISGKPITMDSTGNFKVTAPWWVLNGDMKINGKLFILGDTLSFGSIKARK